MNDKFISKKTSLTEEDLLVNVSMHFIENGWIISSNFYHTVILEKIQTDGLTSLDVVKTKIQNEPDYNNCITLLVLNRDVDDKTEVLISYPLKHEKDVVEFFDQL